MVLVCTLFQRITSNIAILIFISTSYTINYDLPWVVGLLACDYAALTTVVNKLFISKHVAISYAVLALPVFY